MSQELPQVIDGKASRYWPFVGIVAVLTAALLSLPGAQVAQSAQAKKTTTTKKKSSSKATTTKKKSSTNSPTTKATKGTTKPASTKAPVTDPPVTAAPTLAATTGPSTKPPTTPVPGPDGVITWFIPGTGKVVDLGATDVAKLAAGAKLAFEVRGQQGLASTGEGSVVLDITTQIPTQSGRVTLTPESATYAQPVVSAQAQFVAGATTINRIAVPVGQDAKIRVDTTPGPQNLTISVVGWVVQSKPGITETRGFALQPCRVVDSANNVGLSGQVTPARPFDIPAAGVKRIPAPTAAQPPSMVLVGVSLKDATTATSLNVLPTGQQTPLLTLNAVAGNNPAGVFAIPVGLDPHVAFYVTQGSANLIVDLLGYTDKDGNAFSAGPC